MTECSKNRAGKEAVMHRHCDHEWLQTKAGVQEGQARRGQITKTPTAQKTAEPHRGRVTELC